MYFWRGTDFKTLAEAAEFASAVPAWAEYANFCSLLERGLRKDAFTRLETFIASAAGWPLPAKQEFASWLYHFAHGHREGSNLLMPHPLRVKFLEPTLVEWVVREPESGEPHRWLGSPEHLEEAVRLDPTDDIAREGLARHIFGGVDYSLSHLSCCNRYAGDPEEDLRELEKVEALVEGMSDGEMRAQYYVELWELRECVEDYLRGET